MDGEEGVDQLRKALMAVADASGDLGRKEAELESRVLEAISAAEDVSGALQEVLFQLLADGAVATRAAFRVVEFIVPAM